MKTFNQLMDNGTVKELYEFVKEKAVGTTYYLTDSDKRRVEKGCSGRLGGRIFVTSSVGLIDWKNNEYRIRQELDKTLLWGLEFTSGLEPKFIIYSPHEKADATEQANAIKKLDSVADALPDGLKEQAVADASTLIAVPPPLLAQVAAADAPVETTVPGNTPVMYVANRWGVDLCKVDVPDYHNNIERVTALGHSGLGSIFSDPVANYASVAVAMTFKLGPFTKRNHTHTILRISLSNLQPYIFDLYTHQLIDGRTYINSLWGMDLEKEYTINVDYNFGEAEVKANLYDSDGKSYAMSHSNITTSTHELLFVQFGSSEEGMFSTRPDDTSMPMYGMKILERSVTLVK